VQRGGMVFLSGQIPLDPSSGLIVEGDIEVQARRAFDNLLAVCEAAGGTLDDVARLGLYLTDLGQFAQVNQVMAEYFTGSVPGPLHDRAWRRCRVGAQSRSTRS
jgi:reactive intermediate/imine deaminase